MSARGILILAVLFASTFARAGITTANFDCKSASGRTVFKMWFPVDEEPNQQDTYVGLQVDQAVKAYGNTNPETTSFRPDGIFKNYEYTPISVMYRKSKKTINIKVFGMRNGWWRQVLEFDALPETIKGEKDNFTLTASLSGEDPRDLKKGLPPYVSVNCTVAEGI